MNVKFKEVFNSPEDFAISNGEVLSKFVWDKKNYYLIFKQDTHYSQPNILFVEQQNILELVNEVIPSWEYVKKITSKCIYDGILHFELKLEDVYAPNWMIENPEFYAYSLYDLGKAFELIYKFEPNIFKNKKDIDIWNADLN